MEFNLTLLDGTYLQSVNLTTTKTDFRPGQLKNKEQFYKWLESNGEQRMYFCGAYAQGEISHPKIIKSYEILEDKEHQCTLICKCGKVYDYIPQECKQCGNVFVDC